MARKQRWKLKVGMGMEAAEGDPTSPITVLTKKKRGASLTSSYDEEKATMNIALEWLLPSHDAAAVCIDRPSLLNAI